MRTQNPPIARSSRFDTGEGHQSIPAVARGGWSHSVAACVAAVAIALAGCGTEVADEAPDGGADAGSGPTAAECAALICGSSGATASVADGDCVCTCDASGHFLQVNDPWPLSPEALANAQAAWAGFCPTAH